jgi:glutaminyl-tRNA synthetase
LKKLEIFPSKQYEFARLNMTYTVMSKRKLLQLVEEGHVNGWDDPRMPTISGMRRRDSRQKASAIFVNGLAWLKRKPDRFQPPGILCTGTPE